MNHFHISTLTSNSSTLGDFVLRRYWLPFSLSAHFTSLELCLHIFSFYRIITPSHSSMDPQADSCPSSIRHPLSSCAFFSRPFCTYRLRDISPPPSIYDPHRAPFFIRPDSEIPLYAISMRTLLIMRPFRRLIDTPHIVNTPSPVHRHAVNLDIQVYFAPTHLLANSSRSPHISSSSVHISMDPFLILLRLHIP